MKHFFLLIILFYTTSSIMIYSSNQNINIKIDNFALKVINSLSQQNLNYYWSYLPMHIGYDKFDEGVALLSKYPIENTNIILLSQNDNYRNYNKQSIFSAKKGGKVSNKRSASDQI